MQWHLINKSSKNKASLIKVSLEKQRVYDKSHICGVEGLASGCRSSGIFSVQPFSGSLGRWPSRRKARNGGFDLLDKPLGCFMIQTGSLPLLRN